jgi:hypothetical protein
MLISPSSSKRFANLMNSVSDCSSQKHFSSSYSEAHVASWLCDVTGQVPTAEVERKRKGESNVCRKHKNCPQSHSINWLNSHPVRNLHGPRSTSNPTYVYSFFLRGEVIKLECEHCHIGGTRWRSCSRYCAASRKVTGSIPDEVIGFFQLT